MHVIKGGTPTERFNKGVLPYLNGLPKQGDFFYMNNRKFSYRELEDGIAGLERNMMSVWNKDSVQGVDAVLSEAGEEMVSKPVYTEVIFDLDVTDEELGKFKEFERQYGVEVAVTALANKGENQKLQVYEV